MRISRLALLPAALAATVSYDFSVDWVRANPDGAFERSTIGINGEWPIPRIEASVGDTVLVNVRNNLGNQSTSLHFHGLFMNGSNHMDGPSQVTQCPIQPGESFLYNFTITQPGTYWYHSHTESQYPDGLRGPLIIHDPKSPLKGKYDEELVMTISDWYYDQMQTLIPEFMRKGNPTGAEPVPQAALMNETQDFKVPVQIGKTYFLRLANIGAFAGQYFWIEGHNMTIVEVDGAYTKPAQANMVYLSAGQRCSVLVTTKEDSSANFPIVASMDTDLFDILPDDLNWNVTGWLVYDDEKPLPKPSVVYDFDPYDDMDLVPYDEMARLPEPSRSIELDVIMDNLRDGANYAFFNNITYRAPKVPTLYTALTSGKQATNPQIYGTYTHSFVLEKDEIVQLVINNRDDGRHPFHLHGHHFQVLYRSDDDAGDFDGSVEFAETPMRRDTVVVNGNGNVVLRFKADNPGVWLFHCHIEWHVTSGLIATFVEDPLALQVSLKLPQNHLDACKAGNIPTVGNAAGNTDLLDLTGENVPPPRLPEGFTLKGILAFAFSTFMGIFGIYTVASYGMKKDKTTPETAPLLAEEEPQH
ncbi:related to cell surface ferroxidase [Fusarium fujikuroi IMI 58289]|uniref:Related to cell surface ferroxidase n=2 Tax=Fusarium fujikuroi TaxID=5127 RepID=S0EE56_GIBF5|nr:related to cell surface ferroxidase [Fusarium fujikuroi IMI 58289]KLP17170.1 cell surface ferroxidase [Fusarium fujikuroi]CCE73644.1 ferroxidase [Fusarium fujikuroi]CCT72117.1 related to cell surface ferroxidase [Fusarium fujikuroi IMI 58289]SCO18330.1 related to cell surface ferroxidase [Fusarium fujikuroi]SCO55325.1 related to cell surface ferroxidase [Fusarium fujikuroi]